ECRARWPRQHAAQPRGRGAERPGQVTCRFGRRAGLRISADRRSWPRQASHANPEPPTDGRVTTWKKSSPDDRFGSPVPTDDNACEGAEFPTHCRVASFLRSRRTVGYSPEPVPDRAQDAGQQAGKQPEPCIEVALVTVAEPDVVIRLVGRRHRPSLRQVPVPRTVVEHAKHPRGRGRQPPDDRVLHGSHPLPALVVQELAEPETRPEHAGPGLGTAAELDDEPGPVPAKCVRTACRLNPGNDELPARRPPPDSSGRRLAAFKAPSSKARPQRSQSLPVNHQVRYHALHQPTIAKSRPLAEASGHGQDSELFGRPLRVSATSRQNMRSRTPGRHGRPAAALDGFGLQKLSGRRPATVPGSSSAAARRARSVSVSTGRPSASQKSCLPPPYGTAYAGVLTRKRRSSASAPASTVS